MNKHKKIFAVLTLACFLFTLMPMAAFAENTEVTSGKCGENATWSFDAATGTLTISGSGAMYDYIQFAEPWDNLKDDISIVYIDKNITKLAHYFLVNWDTLEKITVAEGNTSFKSIDGVLYNATGTELILYPEAKTDEEFTILDGVVSITHYTFMNSRIKTLNISSTCIDDDLMDIYWYDLETVNVEEDNPKYSSKDGVLFNGDGTILYVYPSSKNTKEYTIPEGTVRLSENAFRHNNDYLQILNIPVSLTTMEFEDEYGNDSNLLAWTNNLKEINVDSYNESYASCDGVLYDKTMKTLLFYPRAKLGEVFTIPDGVETVKRYAFSKQENIRKLIIPDTVVSIEKTLYSSPGEGLEMIEVGKENTVYTSKDGVLFNKDMTELIWYPDCKVDELYEVPETTEKIGMRAFNYCKNLKQVKLPSSLNEIGDYAFGACTKLTSIEIPDNVSKIGESAFTTCHKLTKVDLPNNMTKIPENLFGAAHRLKNIIVPDGVEKIDFGAFTFCYDLNWIYIPETVDEIEAMVFDECFALSDIYYAGTPEQWEKILIGADNSYLLGANIHYNFLLKNTPTHIETQCTANGVELVANEDGIYDIEIAAGSDGTTIVLLISSDVLMLEGYDIDFEYENTIRVKSDYEKTDDIGLIVFNIFDNGILGTHRLTLNVQEKIPVVFDIHVVGEQDSENVGSSGTTNSGGGSSYTPSTNQSTDDITINNTNSNLSIETSDVKTSVISNAKTIASKDSKLSVIGGNDCAVNISAEDKQGNAVNGFFTPLTVEIPVDSAALKSVDNLNNLTLAKVVTDENGNTSLVYMGGNYDTQTGLFTAYVDEPGDYVLVEDADVKKIELQIGNRSTEVNGNAITSDVAPRIINNHTYVPLRYIAEILGCEVAWDEATRTVTITQNGITMKLVIDEKIAGYDVAAVIRENRTLVPLRYIAEMLGANVIWHPETQEIVVVK